MPGRATEFNETEDALVLSFMQYLQTEAGASVYTQRNYRQALHEFTDWYTTERKQPPAWLELKKLNFRGYLRPSNCVSQHCDPYTNTSCAAANSMPRR